MEIEAKYTVPDRPTFQRLLALTALGGYALRLTPALNVVDHYFDTPARALLQAGYALRLRDAGDHWRGTLKGLGGAEGALHQREEYEVDLLPGATGPQFGMGVPAEWPAGPARDLALRLGGEQPLAELFTVRQQRAPRLVWNAGEQVVAELSLDEVAYTHAPGQPPDLILEIELKDAGAPDDLAVLQAALTEFALTPQPQSKFARGLALLEAAPVARPPKPKSPGVRADMRMAEAGRQLLHFHYHKMLDQLPGVIAGVDIEAVHAMRVAARRQRAALSLFAGYFKPKALRPFREALKAVAAGLGAVRDLDVQLAAARAYQAGLPAAIAAGLDPVLTAWAVEREAARVALFAHLDRREFRRFQKGYAKFLATEGAGVAPRPDPAAPVLVRDVLPARLWEHYGAVRAYSALLPAADVLTLHALRIEAKRLRYVLEFFVEALGPGAPAAIAAVTALQDHLGELHDADVTLARLALCLQARHPRPTLATVRAVEGYLQVQQARLTQLQRTARRPWKVLAGRDFRQALGQFVARL